MSITERKNDRLRTYLLLFLTIVAGVLLNFLGARLNGLLSLPFYIDNIGTILVAMLGGYLPSIAVGFFSNLLSGIASPMSPYYSSITVLIALAASFFSKKRFLTKFPHILLPITTFALLGGGLGSIITYFLYGGDFGEGLAVDIGTWITSVTGMGSFPADILGNITVDFIDKAIVTVIAVGAFLCIPKSFRKRFKVFFWDTRTYIKRKGTKDEHMSLRVKVLLFVTVISVLISFGASVVSITQYHNAVVNDYIDSGNRVAVVMEELIDTSRIDAYLKYGSAAHGYRDVEEILYEIRDSTLNVEYVYYYKIDEDGSHVIFDLDNEDVEADKPGDLIENDEYITKNLDKFLNGEEVEPTITNDEFGWLLTVYRPIHDSKGNIMCYACVDLSMQELKDHETVYLTKSISLFIAFLILVLNFSLWIADKYITHPINRISRAAEAFVHDTGDSKNLNMQKIEGLEIQSYDEIGNLYLSVKQMMYDTVSYTNEIQQKSAQISKLQNGLILVLADMVESRDKNTGDHVRKTAAYTKVILYKMKEEGMYEDILTDQYIENVINTAPLHDVGKISVSDTLLNKPGKLTDEEFKIMQSHTTAGSDIIEKAIETVDMESEYLTEAKNLAAYHHEKYNGKGYPYGLEGEDIPLSARIMAVADVFDALVSRRSYKEPFPVDKALDIIREGSGSHFDPEVVRVFLECEDEVRKIAKMNLNIELKEDK